MEVLAGREDPEGLFALCLSALGDSETRSQFLSHIEPLSTANSSLHSVLTSIYKEYFSKVTVLFNSQRGYKLHPKDKKNENTQREKCFLKRKKV